MFILFIISKFALGCQINGYESGVCSQRVQISDGVEFCNYELDDYICVPELRKLWPDHTIESRDKEIRLDFVAYIRDRLVQEINGEVDSVLIKDDTCYKAYKQFLCKWNFPPCDQTTNLTIPICQSYCTSYYENCGLNLTPCLQYFQKLVQLIQLLLRNQVQIKIADMFYLQIFIIFMKSLSVSKYYNNNSLLTPDKRLSRQTTQSTQKKDALSVQSYFSEQSYLKSEASKKEIIRLIKSTVDSIDKNIGMRELNVILTKLLAGLSSCINEQDMSLILIQLIQSIKQIIHNNQTNEKQVYDQERAQLLIQLQQLEQQSKENQLKFENKLKEYEIQHRVLQYQDELNQMKKNQGNKDNLHDRNKLKDQIKEMQQKMLTLSEKERKLIQLVKAVKSRGIDVEKIYKNLNVFSSKNSKRTSKQSNSEVEDISFTESNLADNSQLDYSVGNIKRHAKFVID